MIDFIKYFPEKYTPRPNQVKVLNQLSEIINNKQRFVILQCPTGTGKSHIANTIANASSDCPEDIVNIVNSYSVFRKNIANGKYIHEEVFNNAKPWGAACLTVTKHLQNQYESVFSESKVLKGKGNYNCNLEPMLTADIAPCTLNSSLIDRCVKSHGCAYFDKLKDNLKSKHQVYNYSKFLSIPSFARKKQFLICDEASEVEEMIVGHFSTDLNYKMMDYYNINYGSKIKDDNIHKNIKWLENVANEMTLIVNKLQQKSTNSTYPTRDKQRDIKILKFCKTQLEKISLIIKGYKISDYVCNFDKDNVSFTPVYVDKLSQYLWAKNKHIILMSGTIFDVDTYTKSLGIKEYEYIEVDSEFSPEKSPIYIPAKYSLNYSNLDKNLPLVAKQAEEICNIFKNDNGIIHTHTNKITSAFKKQIKNHQRFLFRENHITNECIMIEHVESEHPTVLVSPSMAFGVDLQGDLSKFQIIVKLPYLSLGDKRVNKIFKENKEWYTMKMFVKLIQMCGRSTRSDIDESCTYILDKAAIDAIKRNWNKLPSYFKERLK